jgi:hypothetical protein
MSGAVWWEVLFTAILVAAFLYAPTDAAGRRPAFSAYTIVLFLFFVYVSFPAALSLLNGEQYIWAPAYGGDAGLATALAYCVVALVTFVVAHRVTVQIVGSRALTAVRLVDEPKPSVLPAWVPMTLVVVGLGLKLYLIMSTGGIQQTLIRMAGNGAVYDDVTAFDPTALLVRGVSGLADVGAVWILLDALRTRKHLAVSAALFAVVMAASYVTVGKRLALVLPLLALVVGFSVLVRHLSVRLIPVLLIAFLGFGMVTLLVRIFLPASAAQVNIDLNTVSYAKGSVLAFYFNSLEFSTVEMITVATRSAQVLNDSLGGAANTFFQTSVVPFSFGIPRAIWLEKPTNYYDLSYAVSSLLNHQRVEDTSVGYVTTLVGTAFVTAGPLGVVAGFCAFGAAVVVLDRMLLARSWSNSRIIGYAFVLMCVFHFFRMGTLAWTFLIGVLQQDGFLLGALALTIAASVPARSIARIRATHPPAPVPTPDKVWRA